MQRPYKPCYAGSNPATAIGSQRLCLKTSLANPSTNSFFEIVDGGFLLGLNLFGTETEYSVLEGFAINSNSRFDSYQVYFRELAEWSKVHDWKSCKPLKGFVGSIPILSVQYGRRIYLLVDRLKKIS